MATHKYEHDDSVHTDELPDYLDVPGWVWEDETQGYLGYAGAAWDRSPDDLS